MTLQELGLTDATIRRLNNEGIDSAEQLTEMNEEDVIKVKGIGRKHLEMIFWRMEENGLHFKDWEGE